MPRGRPRSDQGPVPSARELVEAGWYPRMHPRSNALKGGTRGATREMRLQVARERWDRVSEKAAEVVGGLFLEPKDKGYNPDASATKATCSMKTWVSMRIVEQEREDARTMHVTERELGKVILESRIGEDEWEREVERYDRMGAKGGDRAKDASPSARVVDVAADMVKGGEGGKNE